jgi:hypothetical protein
MAEIAEGSSLLKTVIGLFKQAINTAFPDMTITDADTLVLP